MKRLILFSILILAAVYAAAQPPEPEDCMPRRKPEEVAKKQTEMLVRELGLTDSSVIDTLYRVHLRYARLRHEGCSREDDMNRLCLLENELSRILTAEQYAQFRSHRQQGPRRPQPPFYRSPRPGCPAPSAAPTDSAPNRPAAPLLPPQ